MSGFGNLEDLGSNPGSATYQSFNFSKTLTIYKMDTIPSTLRFLESLEKKTQVPRTVTHSAHSEHKQLQITHVCLAKTACQLFRVCI